MSKLTATLSIHAPETAEQFASRMGIDPAEVAAFLFAHRAQALHAELMEAATALDAILPPRDDAFLEPDYIDKANLARWEQYNLRDGSAYSVFRLYTPGPAAQWRRDSELDSLLKM